MKSQVEAVYEATRAVLKENKINFVDGQNVKDFINDEIKASIVSIIVKGLKSGEITLRDGYDHSKLNAYTKGMVSNWFRKDTRLNGGSKHQIANPGSRAGSSDSQVKEMRKLLKTYENQDEEDRNPAVEAQIKEAIETKVKEIQKEKRAKSTNIDVENLPDELKHLAL